MALPFGLSDYTVSLTLIVILLLGVALKTQTLIVQHIICLQQMILIVLLPALLHDAVINLSMDEMPSLVKYNAIVLCFTLFLLVSFTLLWFCTRFTHDSCELRTLGFLFVVLAPGTSSIPYIDAIVPHIEPGDVTTGHAGMATISVLLVACTVLYLVASLLSAHTTRRNADSGAVLQQSMRPTEASTSPKSSIAWCICMQVRRVIFEPCTFSVLSALGILLAGIDLEQTWIWGSSVRKLAACCTPAVFLLIGMKLKFPKKEQIGVIMLMVFRCGLALLFVCGLRNMIDLAENETMFWLLFCSSSISFIPYGHIMGVETTEETAILKRCSDVLMTLREACLQVEVNDIAQELYQLSSICVDGGMLVEDAVSEGQEIVSRLKSTTVPFYAAHSDLLGIQQAERTFDAPTALFFITVSTMVSVTVCTTFAVVPVSVLTTTGVLPSLSAAFLVSSITYLARPSLFHRDEHGNHGELGRCRLSVIDSSSLDEMTVYEAHAEILRGRGSVSEASQLAEAIRLSEYHAIRKTVVSRSTRIINRSSFLTDTVMPQTSLQTRHRSTRISNRSCSVRQARQQDAETHAHARSVRLSEDAAACDRRAAKMQSLYSRCSALPSALPTLLAEPPIEAWGEGAAGSRVPAKGFSKVSPC